VISESARVSSAAEAKFRIKDPNSQPRVVKVIALDKRSEQVVKELAQSQWRAATFFTASAFASTPRENAPFSVDGWLSDLAGRTKNLLDEVTSADLVVMIGTPGENADAAAIIGEACSVNHVMTTSLIISSPSTSDEVLSNTLSHLRPHSRMLVIAGAEDYIADMLVALRA
jgi:hypothetical protein